MYTNCDTLTNKTSELKLAIDSNHPDIIVLTEVTPKNNRYILQKSEIEIKGYNLYISDFEETNTRGVAVYVKKYITSNQVELANAVKDTVWVEITLEKEKKMIMEVFIEVLTTITIITNCYLRQFIQHHNLIKITYY